MTLCLFIWMLKNTKMRVQKSKNFKNARKNIIFIYLFKRPNIYYVYIYMNEMLFYIDI